MIGVLVIFIIISVTLFFLFIMQRKEMQSIRKQLHDISQKNSNELIHTKSGGKISAKLINEINGLFQQMRKIEVSYQKKSHDLDRMMTNIAHDLRTPLTSAMGYIGMIQGQNISEEERQRELEIVEMRLRRLEELINSFFEFSKIISGDELPKREKLNLIELLEQAIANYYDDFCSQERKIEFCCGIKRLMVFSNSRMLMRIFENLISNAYKHGTGDLKISVSDKESITVCFENEFTDACMEIERVFDEFYTTDISRTKGNSGLGLAIAKQFAELLDIELTADYTGTVFSVTAKIPAIKNG